MKELQFGAQVVRVYFLSKECRQRSKVEFIFVKWLPMEVPYEEVT